MSVVILALYTLLGARNAVGVNVAVVPPLNITVPETGVVPSIKVNELDVKVDEAIASLNVTVTEEYIGTFVAKLDGFVDNTMGAVVSGSAVKTRCTVETSKYCKSTVTGIMVPSALILLLSCSIDVKVPFKS